MRPFANCCAARSAAPVEVAHAVHFLASDEASHITGVVVPLDAGYTVG